MSRDLPFLPESDAQNLKLLEAALFASPHPVSLERLSEIFPEAVRPNLGSIERLLEQLAVIYQDRAIVLKKTAQGYTFWVDLEFSPLLQQWFSEKPPRYSKTVLETLAIIAYRQPITRPEIEDIRGVAVSAQTIRTLEERHWIEGVGHRDTPGHPILYATTESFLTDFNLISLEHLEPLQE